MSPALRRTLYVLAAIGSAVVAAFVISAAAVHALVPDLVRALGDDVELEYEHAWLMPTGWLHLRGMDLRIEDRRGDWQLRADTAWAKIDVTELGDRHLSIDGMRASGVAVVLQPIERERPRGRRWQVSLRDVGLRHVREIRRGNSGLRDLEALQGSLHVDDEIRIEASAVVKEAQAVLRGQVLVEAVDGELALSGSLPRGAELDRALLKRFDSRVACVGTVTELQHVNGFLPSSLDVSSERPARLTVDLAFASGELEPGTRVSVESDALSLASGPFVVQGPARGSLRVDETAEGVRTVGEIAWSRFQLRERSSPPRGIARGKGLALIAESDTGSLHASDIRVAGRLDIPPTQFDDIKLVQRWLPRDIGLAFDDGTASLSGHLQVSDAAAGDVTGALALRARDLRGHWDEATFEGDFLVKTALRVADLGEGVFDLEEMSASASDVRWRAAAGALWVDDWWLRVDMPSGRASLATPRSLSGRVHYTLASSDPLLNVLVDEDEVAGWVHDLLEQPDVEGSAFLAIQEDAYAIRDLVVHAGRRSELRLEMERRGSWRRGVLWAQLGLLSTGVEFDGPRRRVRLLKGVSWFERKEAEL